MKRTICILLILVMCLSFCACTSARSNYTSVVPAEAESIDFSDSVTVVSPPTPVASTVVYTPAPTAEPTPTPTATVAPTPTPTIVIVNTNSNPITKSPYDDFVAIGGTVKFVATASNYSSLKWIIKSPDSTLITNATNAPSAYSGLSVSGQGTTTLVLSNVPSSMDGCLIQCVFTCGGYDYYTNNAILSVINSTPTPQDAIAISANTCHDQYAVIATGQGYTSSAISNYYVSDSIASFNIDFKNTSYLVRGEFSATATSSRPVHIYVYDAAGTTLKRDASISTADDFKAILISPLVAS